MLPPTLRPLLVDRGLSVRMLADQVGVSAQAAYDWCARRRRPASHRIRAIADALGVTVRQIERRIAPRGTAG